MAQSVTKLGGLSTVLLLELEFAIHTSTELSMFSADISIVIGSMEWSTLVKVGTTSTRYIPYKMLTEKWVNTDDCSYSLFARRIIVYSL
jgi:hypothetical protein